MVEYVVDEKARNMIRLAAGLYKFSEKVDGFLEQSLYWSALCFEHIIHCTARSYGVHTAEKDLWMIIEEICSSPRIKHVERENQRHRLNRLKTIRNRMFHADNLPIMHEQAADMIKAICNMAEPDLSFEEVRKEITYEQVRKLRDNLLKVYGSPLRVETLDEQDICESDFDDLDVLYEKCKFLHFKRLKSLLLSLRLEPEEMSELIPTSAAIWLPWVVGQSGARSHIQTIVLGVTFTPSFVRIGVDFGSEAYRAKEVYYSLLLRGALNPQLIGLPDDYYLIDTFWYFNVRNQRLIKDYWPSKTDEIKPEISAALAEIREKRRAQIPMKEHRLLIGKILRRSSPEFCDFLTKVPQTINSAFGDLIEVVRQVEQSSKIS